MVVITTTHAYVIEIKTAQMSYIAQVELPRSMDVEDWSPEDMIEVVRVNE